METAFLRMWDVPISLIFCSSCIVMLPGICCIYFSSPFFSSSRVILSLPELLRLLPLHSFNFDFKVSLFWQFSSYFNWSALLSGDGHINEQAAFFVSVLDYNVWSVGFISQSVCTGISHKIVMLSFSVSVWGSCSYHFWFFCLYSSLLKLATWIMFPLFAKYWMPAFLDISQSSPWNVVTICFILPLSQTYYFAFIGMVLLKKSVQNIWTTSF